MHAHVRPHFSQPLPVSALIGTRLRHLRQNRDPQESHARLQSCGMTLVSGSIHREHVVHRSPVSNRADPIRHEIAVSLERGGGAWRAVKYEIGGRQISHDHPQPFIDSGIAVDVEQEDGYDATDAESEPSIASFLTPAKGLDVGTSLMKHPFE